jgi:hypothetical protein
VLGTAIIQQRVTELLDVPAIIRTYAPDWCEQAATHLAKSAADASHAVDCLKIVSNEKLNSNHVSAATQAVLGQVADVQIAF